MGKHMKVFWFSGVWMMPVGITLSWAIGSLIRALGSLKYMGTGYIPPLDPWTVIKLVLLSFLPTLICFAINLIRYYFFGVRDFRPFQKKNPLTISDDKLNAMNATDESEFSSTKLCGFIVGRLKNRYFCIPKDPNNILHTLVIGGPGSGKSSTLLNTLISNYQVVNPHEAMTVFAIDIKPELQRKSVDFDESGNRVRVLNPSSMSPLFWGWDVYYGLNEYSSDDEVEERCDSIARSLIVSEGHGDNEIFYATARNLLVAFLIYGFYTGRGFVDSMLMLMTLPLKDLIAEILMNKKVIAAHPRLRTILQTHANDDSEMLKDAENTMRENLRIFNVSSVQYMLRDNPRKADPRNLTNRISIFLTLPDNLLKQYRPLFNMITQQVIDYLASIPEWERADKDVPIIWLLIDEFGSIGKMQIEEPLARLRSRKVCIWLCVQGVAQLDKTYGKDGRRVIMDNCSALIVFDSKDPETAKYFSDISGQYRETKISNYRNGITKMASTSQNVSQEYRNIFNASDFAKLRKVGKVFCFIDGDYYYIDKCPYFKIKELKHASDIIRSRNDAILGFNGEGNPDF